MKICKFTSLVCLNILMVVLSDVAHANTKLFIPKKSYSFDAISCASQNGKTYTPGTFTISRKRKVFKPLAATIAELKRGTKSRSSKHRNESIRKLKQFQQIQKLGWICKLGKKPTISAQNSTSASTGIQPVAVSLNVKAPTKTIPVEYDVISQTGSGTVQKYPNLTALVSPASHRTGRIDFKIIAKQKIGKTTIRSNQATVSVYWTQNGDFIGDPLSLATYRDSLSAKEARHLARWINMGANSADIVREATSPGGLDRAISKLLTRSNSSQCATVEAQALSIANMDKRVPCRTIAVDDGTGTIRYPWFCGDESNPANKEIWLLESGQNYFLHMSRFGCDPMRERIANFWSNQFAANLGNYSNWTEKSHYIKKHIDLLRSNGSNGSLLASYPSLLSKMHGQDGAMLLALNNNLNDYRTFGNENYARELLELFSMGRRDAITGQINYTESDVYATSFAVMGWTESRVTVRNMTFTCTPTFDANNEPTNECARLPAHLRTQTSQFQEDRPTFDNNRWNHATRPTKQRFFEGTPWESYEAYKSDTISGQDTITPYLLTHPGVARFIATRLIATFVTVEPTNEMVDEVANIIRASNYAIEPALAKLFTSSAFYAKAGKNGIASPYESSLSLIRGLGLPLGRSQPGAPVAYNLYSVLRDLVGNSGQRLFQHPTIFGYKEIGKITGGVIHRGTTWLGLQSWLERGRGVISYLNAINAAKQPLGFAWTQVLEGTTNLRNPNEIVEQILNKSGVTVSDSKKSVLVSYLTTAVLRTKIENSVRIPDPAFQRTINWAKLSDSQLNALLDLKIPGLISIVSQLKEANVR